MAYDKVVEGFACNKNRSFIILEAVLCLFRKRYKIVLSHFQTRHHLFIGRIVRVIKLDSVSVIQLRGPFCYKLGLDPPFTHTLTQKTPLSVRLLIHGHNFICLESFVIHPQLNSLHAEQLLSTQLLGTIPIQRTSGDIEIPVSVESVMSVTIPGMLSRFGLWTSTV